MWTHWRRRRSRMSCCRQYPVWVHPPPPPASPPLPAAYCLQTRNCGALWRQLQFFNSPPKSTIIIDLPHPPLSHATASIISCNNFISCSTAPNAKQGALLQAQGARTGHRLRLRWQLGSVCAVVAFPTMWRRGEDRWGGMGKAFSSCPAIAFLCVSKCFSTCFKDIRNLCSTTIKVCALVESRAKLLLVFPCFPCFSRFSFCLFYCFCCGLGEGLHFMSVYVYVACFLAWHSGRQLVEKWEKFWRRKLERKNCIVAEEYFLKSQKILKWIIYDL